MTLGIGAGYTSLASSAAAPRDSGLTVKSQPENTRTDEAAPRRAEGKANAERSNARAAQVAKEVLEIETVTDKAEAASRRIDTYA